MLKYEKDARKYVSSYDVREVPWTLLFIRLRRVIVIYEALLAKTLVSGYDLFTIVNSAFMKLRLFFLSMYI